MKRTLQLLLAFSFVAMFLISPVAAATDQGLEWGIALDDEFTYQMTFTEEGVELFSEGLNVTVIETPPTIDDPLTNWTNIGSFDLNMTFYNGTSIGLYGLLFLGLMTVGGHFAVPVGNYSLLTDLAMAESWWNDNLTLIDNALFWGVSFSATAGEVEQTMMGEFLKEDGFLSRYSIVMSNSSIESGVTVIRDNLPVLTTPTTNTTGTAFDIVGFVTDNILYIGVGIGVLLVLVIIIKRR
ncbi:MAG: hypothetical protein ACTSWA_11230 [Candidatus Thorarchaeota archaeon]